MLRKSVFNGEMSNHYSLRKRKEAKAAGLASVALGAVLVGVNGNVASADAVDNGQNDTESAQGSRNSAPDSLAAADNANSSADSSADSSANSVSDSSANSSANSANDSLAASSANSSTNSSANSSANSAVDSSANSSANSSAVVKADDTKVKDTLMANTAVKDTDPTKLSKSVRMLAATPQAAQTTKNKYGDFTVDTNHPWDNVADPYNYTYSFTDSGTKKALPDDFIDYVLYETHAYDRVYNTDGSIDQDGVDYFKHVLDTLADSDDGVDDHSASLNTLDDGRFSIVVDPDSVHICIYDGTFNRLNSDQPNYYHKLLDKTYKINSDSNSKWTYIDTDTGVAADPIASAFLDELQDFRTKYNFRTAHDIAFGSLDSPENNSTTFEGSSFVDARTANGDSLYNVYENGTSEGSGFEGSEKFCEYMVDNRVQMSSTKRPEPVTIVGDTYNDMSTVGSGYKYTTVTDTDAGRLMGQTAYAEDSFKTHLGVNKDTRLIAVDCNDLSAIDDGGTQNDQINSISIPTSLSPGTDAKSLNKYYVYRNVGTLNGKTVDLVYHMSNNGRDVSPASIENGMGTGGDPSDKYTGTSIQFGLFDDATGDVINDPIVIKLSQASYASDNGSFLNGFGIGFADNGSEGLQNVSSVYSYATNEDNNNKDNLNLDVSLNPYTYGIGKPNMYSNGITTQNSIFDVSYISLHHPIVSIVNNPSPNGTINQGQSQFAYSPNFEKSAKNAINSIHTYQTYSHRDDSTLGYIPTDQDLTNVKSMQSSMWANPNNPNYPGVTFDFLADGPATWDDAISGKTTTATQNFVIQDLDDDNKTIASGQATEEVDSNATPFKGKDVLTGNGFTSDEGFKVTPNSGIDLSKYTIDDASRAALDSAHVSDNPAPITIGVHHRQVPVQDDPNKDKDINTATKWTVNETINVTNPDGTKSTPVNTSVTFNRSATQDAVTGKITYGAWNKDSQDFAAYTAPSVAGYTAGSVPAQTIKPGDKDLTFNISYTPNNQTGKIHYVDANGKEVGTTNLSGKTGETVTITPQAPNNYAIVPGQNIPATEKATANGIPDVTVKVVLAHIDVTDQHKNDHDINTATTWTVKETINVTNTDGTQDTPISKLVTFNRTATEDGVTHKVTYGAWSPATATFDAYNAPEIKGYTASENVPAQTVKPGDTDLSFDIYYEANKQTVTYQFHDDTLNKDVGAPISVDGTTNETKTIAFKIPNGYNLASGQPAAIDYTFSADGNDPIVVHLVHSSGNVNPDDKNYNKQFGAITREVHITDPSGKTTTQTQVINIKRNLTEDEATGVIDYADAPWVIADQSKNLDVVIPDVNGYKITADSGNVENGNRIPALGADSLKYATQTDQTNFTAPAINVTYTADQQNRDIEYLDNGQVVYTAHVTGNMGQTVSGIKNNPAYRLPDSDNTFTDAIGETHPKYQDYTGQLPDSITFNGDNTPVKVNLTHNIVDITKDNGYDQWASDPSHDGATTKTVTRSFKIVSSDPNVQVETPAPQHVTFNRTITQDGATGQIIRGDWKADGVAQFPAVSLNIPDGYNVDKQIPAMTVTPTTPNQVVTINLSPNAQVVNVIFEYGDQTQSVDQLTGITGQTINVDIQKIMSSDPDLKNWQLKDGQDLPSNYTFSANKNKDIVVQIVPKGAGQETDDDHIDKATITRVIKITNPDANGEPNGETTSQVQSHTFTRPKDVDAMTHQTVYGSWSEGGKYTFEGVTLPHKPGYVVVVNGKAGNTDQTVPEEVVTPTSTPNSQVDVTYEALNRTVNVPVSGDNNLPPITVTGKTDHGVTVTLPDGYDLDPNATLPAGVTAGKDDNGNTTITVKVPETDDSNITLPSGITVVHKKTPVSADDPSLANDPRFNTTGSRTVTIENPDGTKSVITQTVPFSRDGEKDEVTGEINPVGDFKPKTDKNGNLAGTVTATTYDKDGKQTGTKTVAGGHMQDGKPYFDALDIPQINGYDASVSQIPAIEAKPGNTSDNTTVTYTSKKVTADADHPNENIPGLTSKDLNKTVTRTINITDKDGKVVTTTQTAKFKRSGTLDEGTGQVTYTDWTGDVNSFPAVDVPKVDGYHAEGDLTNGQIPAMAVNANTPDTTVNIKYVKDQTDADKYPVEVGDVHTKGNQLPDASGAITNKDQLPDGTKFEWTGQPDLAKEHSTGEITVTFPDGSTKTVSVNVTNDDLTKKDADKYPVDVNSDVHVKDGQLPDASSVITNKDSLPAGTTFTWSKNPDLTKEHSTGEITVTFPDGSTKVVSVNVTNDDLAKTDADKYDVEIGTVHIKHGELPDANSVISNMDSLPAGTTAVWSKKPDMNKKHSTGEITVTFPDGSTKKITVDVANDDLINAKKKTVKKKTVKKNKSAKHSTKNANGRSNGYSANGSYANGSSNGNGSGSANGSSDTQSYSGGSGSSNGSLPQTGDDNTAGILAGAMTSALSALGMIGMAKKRKKETD